jgi:lambda family phage tail tape measure protein
MTVATLGLAVDSSQTVAATKALNGLIAAARPAAAAADQLAASGSKSETVMRAMQAAADRSHVSLDTMTKRVSAASQGMASTATSTGLARHELINLSRQIQDVGVSLVSGQSPFMVLAQQGTQIADIFGSSKTGTVGGALRQIAGGIASVLTPMRLLGVAVVAVSTGGIAAISSLAKLSLQFEDTARAAGATVAQMQGFAAAASFKGIGQSDFLTAMEKFAASVYDAKNGMGGLADVLRANHQRAGTLVQDFGVISDLIKAAAGNTQLQFSILSQAGLPATMQWVRFLSQGKDAIAAQAAEFMKNGDQLDAMAAKAKAFQEAWDKAITNFKFGFQSAVLSIVGFFDNLGDKVTSILMKIPKIGASIPTNVLRNAMNDNGAGYSVGSKLTASSSVDQFYSGLGKNAPGNAAAGAGSTVDPNAARHALQLEQQRLALLGSTTTAEEAATAIQLQANQARADGVSVDQRRIDILKQLAREQATGVAQIKASIDSYNIETATIGMSAGAAAQYAAAQNAINDAKRRGQVLSATDVAQIKAQAAALGDAAAKADLMNAAYSGLVRGPLQTLTSQIANGAKFFDALKSAGISALNAIASKLADMAAQSLWTNALGGASGGVGGGLIGGIMNLFKSANGNVFPANDNGISRYSNQIVDRPTVFPFAKGVGLMGEAGPEAIMPLTRGPNGKLGVAASGGSGGGTPQNVNININVSGARGSQEISDAVNEGVSRGLAAYRKSPQFAQDIGNASKKAGTLRVGRG